MDKKFEEVKKQALEFISRCIDSEWHSEGYPALAEVIWDELCQLWEPKPEERRGKMEADNVKELAVVTREEAIEFIRRRQADVASGSTVARFLGCLLCSYDDSEEKQIEDYIKNKGALLIHSDQVKQGGRIYNQFLASLSPGERVCVEEFIEDQRG